MGPARFVLLLAFLLPGCSGGERAPEPPATQPTQSTQPDDWTAGVRRSERPYAGVATQSSIRTARHDGFDRIVLEFRGDSLPGWLVEYVDRPIIQCGSGDAVPVDGDGWLQIRVTPARAHDDNGRATITSRRSDVALPTLQELVLTCDFEAHLEWVAGVRSPRRFRVLELRDPSRLVVDIRHAQ